jgi:hypothetical protein
MMEQLMINRVQETVDRAIHPANPISRRGLRSDDSLNND